MWEVPIVESQIVSVEIEPDFIFHKKKNEVNDPVLEETKKMRGDTS
jgi:hypothetical protein